MADNVPGVSQLKSLVQWLCDDSEGARQTQENFLKETPVISQVTSIVQLASGDVEGAVQTQVECAKRASRVLNTMPVVGPVKCAIHYALGDKDGGAEAKADIIQSVVNSKAAVLAVGGPIGLAIAGSVDGLATIGNSLASGEFKPVGYVKAVTDIYKDPTNPGKWFDAGFSLSRDVKKKEKEEKNEKKEKSKNSKKNKNQHESRRRDGSGTVNVRENDRVIPFSPGKRAFFRRRTGREITDIDWRSELPPLTQNDFLEEFE